MQDANRIKAIRTRLGVTQEALASALGCTQKNVSFYEHGQPISAEVAKKLIIFGSSLGHTVTYEDVFGPATVDAATEN
jgi:putative transcriptional regulator